MALPFYIKNPLKETKILQEIIYLYNILSLSGGGRPFHPSVLSSILLSIHSTSSSPKKKMMEEEEDDESDSSKLKISN
jgi:hypothetical protein